MRYLNFFFNTPVKKRLAGNFFSLSVLHVANYVLPLITLPYLVRVLLPEKYGLLAFAQALIQYFNILTDYGFNFSATREISVSRENKIRVSEIFSSVLLLKSFFLLISIIILSIFIFSIPKLKDEWLVYYFTFGIVVGQNLFPRWFFQGIEKMKYITILNLISKVIFTFCIFIFIKTTDDYIYVPLINSLGYIVAGILGVFFAFRSFELKFVIPTVAEIKFQLYEGWHLFLSTLATSMYTTSNVFILGLFASNTAVGYFSAAEKIVNALKDLMSPVFYTIYPYLSKLVSESKESAIQFLRKMVKTVSVFSLLSSIFVFSFSSQIVKLLLGPEYESSVIVLRILAFVPFLGGVNIIFTSLTMLSFNFKKEFSIVILSAGVLSLVVSFSLVPIYKQFGSSLSVIISELFIMMLTLVFRKKHNISLYNK